MAQIKIGEKTYDLRMDVRAMKAIEVTYGDVQMALNKFRKEKSLAIVASLFAILATSGERHAKRAETVSNDALDDCTMGDLDRVAQAMNEAIEEAMHAETVGGNEADDTVVDVYAAQLEAREKNA